MIGFNRTHACQVAPSAEMQGGQHRDVEEDDGLFSVDLKARKAGLRAQLAVFAKVPKSYTSANPARHTCLKQQHCLLSLILVNVYRHTT